MITEAPIRDLIQQDEVLSRTWVNWFTGLFKKSAWPDDNLPNLNGVTQSYSSSGFYVKSGDLVNYTVIIEPVLVINYLSSNYLDNLPYEVLEYGQQNIYNLSSGNLVRTTLIVKDTTNANLTTYTSNSNLALIGSYIAK